MGYVLKPIVWALLVVTAATLELTWGAAPWADERALRNVSLKTGLEAYRQDQVRTQEEQWQALGAKLTDAQWSQAVRQRRDQKM